MRERRLKEQVQRTSQICPKAWEEKCDEVNTHKELASYWKEQYESLKSQSMDWLNHRKHLNEILDEYECTINLLQPSLDAYRTKLANLIEFCNVVAIDLPWKLENALEDMDENNTHPSARDLVLLCERMMRRFKEELKAHKERVAKRTL